MTAVSNSALMALGVTYQPGDFRALVRMVYPSAGVIGNALGTDLKVVETSPISLAVRVPAGRAVVQDSRLTSPLDLYLFTSTASYVTVPITTADLTLTRIDRIVARVKNTEAGDGATSFTIEAVAGTPSGSPAAPAAPVGSLTLAYVTVGPGATTIANASISDQRAFATSDISIPGSAAVIVPGYNGYSWTMDPDDQYVLGGSLNGLIAGRSAWRTTSAGTGNAAGRAFLMRKGQDQAAVGSLVLAGDVAFTTVAGSGKTYLGIGLCLTVASSWDEGVALVLDAAVGSAKFYTNTSTGVDLTAYSAGTQRGSTVAGLAATTWYPYKITISAAGNVKCEFNNATVFDGAGGVDLIATTTRSVTLGMAALTVANEAYVGPSVLSYL